MNNQNTILICNPPPKKNYLSSVSILQFHMFAQMLKMVVQFIASTLSPQRKTRIRASRVFKLNLLRKWFFYCILFGKISLTNIYTWKNEYNFMPKLHKFRPICVSFQIVTTYVPSLKYRFVLKLI